MKVDFERWLEDHFCANSPEILDDDIPDAFADWIGNMDSEDWIEKGQLYADIVAKNTKKELESTQYNTVKENIEKQRKLIGIL